MYCLYSCSMISSWLVGVRVKLAELQTFSWCVKLGVTTMAAIAKLVLVGDRIGWHAAPESQSLSAISAASTQLLVSIASRLGLHPAEVSSESLA